MLLDFFAHEQQLGVAVGGGVGFGGAGRHGVQAVDVYPCARAQPDFGGDGGDVFFHPMAHFGVAQRQAAEEVHAVEVVERHFDAVAVAHFLLQRRQLRFPPAVAFKREHDVGLLGADALQQQIGAAVGSEYVAGEQ